MLIFQDVIASKVVALRFYVEKKFFACTGGVTVNGAFLWNLRNFQEHIFDRTPLAASVVFYMTKFLRF